MSNDRPAISMKIWNDKYRLKTAEGEPVDLNIAGTYRRVSTALAAPEHPKAQKRWADTFFDIMFDGFYSPAGRILAGAGSGRNVTLSNCFTMGTIPDSMEGIFTMLKEAALTMQAGGGIGYDFSTIRPAGALVMGVGADASGPLSFMDVWDAMCRTVMSAGSRRGAMMATMRCDHPSIEDFITAKNDPLRLRNFNLSVLVTDAFMAAVKSDADWDLTFKGKVYKTVKALYLWDLIMGNTYAGAEPGVIFIDRVNEDHNLGYLETVATTNPCGEKPMGPYASCLLGSLNLAFLTVDAFTPNARLNVLMLRKVVAKAIRMMDNVVDVGHFPLPQQLAKAKADRQLGLGITGLADALAMLGMRYGSTDAKAETSRIMREICLTAYQTSADLAIEKGAFPTFDAKGFFKSGTFADRKITGDLRKQIETTGIRNALLISIAPTGTISMFNGNVSGGIEPIFSFGADRKILEPNGEKKTHRVEDYAVAQYRKFWMGNGDNALLGDTFSYDDLPEAFVSIKDLSPMDHIGMQAAAQEWVDSSISKTVNLPEDISFEDFKEVYMMAWEHGCKGCTTYRPNDITGSILSEIPQEKPAKAEAELTHYDMTKEDFLTVTKAIVAIQGNDGPFATHLCDYLTRIGAMKATDLGRPDQFDEALSGVDPDFVMAILHPDLAEIDLGKATSPANALLDAMIEKPRSVTTPAAMGAPYGDPSEQPRPRGRRVEGATYKLKYGDIPEAFYITVNDVVDDNGQLRPIEVFVNSKDIEHFPWIMTATRLMSAVFRSVNDPMFAVKEMMGVADPNGGAWIEGKYVKSLPAAIGNIIHEHISQRLVQEPRPDSYEAVAEEFILKQAHAGPVAKLGKACPGCGERGTMEMMEGCNRCSACGHSKCG